MEKELSTLEQTQKHIGDARDSIWVIEDTIKELSNGKIANAERKSNISINVEHLKIIVADKEVIASGENIADLIAAIATGEGKLAESIWLD